jgi:hypothetical protein
LAQTRYDDPAAANPRWATGHTAVGKAVEIVADGFAPAARPGLVGSLVDGQIGGSAP